MASKHIVRYRLDVTIQGEEPYDPAVPSSYTEALAKIDAKRQAAIGAGGKIKLDQTKPVQVRD